MARFTGTGIELPTRRESMIPTTQETDDELEVIEPLMIENFRQLKAWMKHDGQAVSEMLQELKKAYNDSIDRSNLATDMAESFQKRMNQLEGIVEYQRKNRGKHVATLPQHQPTRLGNGRALTLLLGHQAPNGPTALSTRRSP